MQKVTKRSRTNGCSAHLFSPRHNTYSALVASRHFIHSLSISAMLHFMMQL